MGKAVIIKDEIKTSEDLLPKGSAIIPTKENSLAHDKSSNVRGIYDGKRPKFVKHHNSEE